MFLLKKLKKIALSSNEDKRMQSIDLIETSQPANIGPQDVLSTSPSNVSRVSSKNPIWPSWGRSNLSSWERLEMTSREHPSLTFTGCSNLTYKRCPWEVVSGCPKDVLRTSPRGHWKHVLGTMGVIFWMSLNLFLLFFRNLFNWQIYLKTIQYSRCS